MKTNKQTALYLTLASAMLLGSTQVQAAACYFAPCPDEPWRSLFLNTYYGPSALSSVTTGGSNAAFGENALRFNTTGPGNTAVGANALVFNTTGSDNSASGRLSLYYNTTGTYNTASGVKSLFQNASGWFNTASGSYSLTSNTTGAYNTASGSNSLYYNTTGNNNTASGFNSLHRNTTGIENTGAGYKTLHENTTGNYNAAVGSWAMYKTTTGKFNTALGSSALYQNVLGEGNVAEGHAALLSNTTGSYNVGIGQVAGALNSTGSFNVFIGRTAGLYETGSNKLYIASNPTTPLLYGVFSETAANNKLGIGQNTVPAGDAIAVWNGAHLTTGGVWTNASSRELKENIRALSSEDANRTLAGLSPVRYVYKNSRDEEYVGFIAEDVPDLVATNDHRSLSPMDIVAVLTTVTKDQKAEISNQKAEMAALRESHAAQDERMLQMEMALADLQRKRADDVQLSLSN